MDYFNLMNRIGQIQNATTFNKEVERFYKILLNRYSNNFSKLIIFLSIISAGSYLYALGRSDGPHIKNSFGFPLMTISV